MKTILILLIFITSCSSINKEQARATASRNEERHPPVKLNLTKKKSGLYHLVFSSFNDDYLITCENKEGIEPLYRKLVLIDEKHREHFNINLKMGYSYSSKNGVEVVLRGEIDPRTLEPEIINFKTFTTGVCAIFKNNREYGTQSIKNTAIWMD